MQPNVPTATSDRTLVALEPVALAATRGAAIACQAFVGRGDKEGADGAATEAMRESINAAAGTGTVIIGEGEKDDAPMLYAGERLGNGDGPEFDIAVDPVECTTFCSKGLPGSLATLAFAESGSLLSPGPAFYMDKLVVGPGARDAIDITASPEDTLAAVAEALGKSIEELTVAVLDKPRHEDLIARIHAAGARVSSPSDGDVAGALQALLPDGPADLLMGIGGTPEGVMTACTVSALGGGMQARLAPQGDDEAKAVADAGLDSERIYELEDLAGGESLFCATGITDGLVRAPWQAGPATFTESIVIAAGSVRTVVESTETLESTEREEG